MVWHQKRKFDIVNSGLISNLCGIDYRSQYVSLLFLASHRLYIECGLGSEDTERVDFLGGSIPSQGWFQCVWLEVSLCELEWKDMFIFDPNNQNI